MDLDTNADPVSGDEAVFTIGMIVIIVVPFFVEGGSQAGSHQYCFPSMSSVLLSIHVIAVPIERLQPIGRLIQRLSEHRWASVVFVIGNKL